MNKSVSNFILLGVAAFSLFGNYYLWNQNKVLKHTQSSSEKSVSESLAKPDDTAIATIEVAPKVQDVSQAGADEEIQAVLNSKAYDKLAELLIQRSLPEEIVKLYIAAQIDYDLSGQNVSGKRYWEYKTREPMITAQQHMDSSALKRETLRSIFGDGIVDDPRFEDLFKPYQQTLSFLSSEQQIKLYEIKFNSMVERQKGNIAYSEEREIEALLGPDQYYEYQLRESPTAKHLAQELEGFSYSEQEFRELYRIKMEAAAQNTSSDAYRALNDIPDLQGSTPQDTRETSDNYEEQKIRAYLGEERYKAYSQAKQPNYKRAVRKARENGFSDQDALEAFEIITASSSNLVRLRQDPMLSPEDRSRQIEEIIVTAKNSISGIMGDTAARELVEETLVGPRLF
jgi:hypothetical protein